MWEIEDSIAEQEELNRKQAELDRVCNSFIHVELQQIDLEKWVT